jgi:2-polyprenyl-6-methoxyphenol hydroxylase-like FAD-dependent oxidoreductase
MAEIIVIGGGIGGLSTASLLAKQGHDITVLERDPAPPPASGPEAWDSWERHGVNQFRMIHYFLPRFRSIAEAELPELVKELDADGVLRINPLADAPVEVTGGFREEDRQFDAMTGRRPMVEAAFARAVDATGGITMRRGVAVQGFLTGEPRLDGVPHVTGVVTDTGEELTADLVVDAAGRRSALPTLLTDIGARAPLEEREDSGFMYYGRHYRSADGSLPFAFGPALQPYDSVSLLMLPADNGTWGMGIITSAADTELRAAKDAGVWEAIVRSYPLVAHWTDAEPITEIQLMAKIEDRHRTFVIDGTPVATGVVAVGDSWACTNPSVGRGASIALVHAQALRDHVRDHGLDDPVSFATGWHDATMSTTEGLFRDTLSFDRHRLAEIDAQIAGETYETDDPSWAITKALEAGAMLDPEVLRGYVALASLIERADDVLARPGLFERVVELADAGFEPMPGPSRAELLDIVHAA